MKSGLDSSADENWGSGQVNVHFAPFVETDAAEARLAQRHERVLLDPAAAASGLGVTHVADRLQIAGDMLVPGRRSR